MTQKLLSIALLSTEWVIVFLIILSVVSMAVIIERWVVLFLRGGGEGVESALREELGRSQLPDPAHILPQSQSSSVRVVRRVVGCVQNGIPFEEAIAIAISEEKIELERRIAILGTLGSNAPYIGLLGTVLGIIHAFHNLSMHIQGGPSVILTGISEALVATALGLFIAIPAVGAYNFFVRSIRKILVNAENTVRGLAAVISK